MTTLVVFSDLHLTHHPYRFSAYYDCVVINAGDTHHSASVRSLVKDELVGGNMSYVEVLGNHDFYGGTFPLPGDGQSVVEHDGLVIAGATLWTNVDDASFKVCRDTLNDSYWITEYSYDRMRECHASDWNFLEQAGADVVVTHHAPFVGSVHPEYKRSVYNHCFASDLEVKFSTWKKKPSLWVHGHTHHAFDYRIGDTRVLCHPRGYPGETNFNGYVPRVLSL